MADLMREHGTNPEAYDTSKKRKQCGSGQRPAVAQRCFWASAGRSIRASSKA